MNIGFIGAGSMANAVGGRFPVAGHKLLLSHSHDPAKLENFLNVPAGGHPAGVPFLHR
jgi:3-hydroxyisobutyrate dehydrogenase-like beta-hydroxyacid dehydrogenase